ncbi:RdgB/HAM1 family non-canonical purine NTP pyrophosphatase [Teredinibacter haidensis]|uniref:RdgB/HAM1 family non-canonical purine NTP pyrophosphatase n=1 Tax=Teredinibacter haidensis TaxID=2731755 RepID=UPI000948E40B|nr:RdgB/HAM1 family non-canonical purine NTP pyrophosphatase [Teredinibacter haidensis]
MSKKVVMASGNTGKLREFKTLLTQCDFTVLPQSEFNVPEADETGLTFVENALIKARNACEHTGLPAIADDSGIEVDALMGKPGIYSARFSEGWQGLPANDKRNNEYLLEQLKPFPERKDRAARYQCVLVYMRHAADPTPIVCQESWEGNILNEHIGSNGFGYDPLFYVQEFDCSSAELDKDLKNKISHRGKALQDLLAALKEELALHGETPQRTTP